MSFFAIFFNTLWNKNCSVVLPRHGDKPWIPVFPLFLDFLASAMLTVNSKKWQIFKSICILIIFNHIWPIMWLSILCIFLFSSIYYVFCVKRKPTSILTINKRFSIYLCFVQSFVNKSNYILLHSNISYFIPPALILTVYSSSV